jgi:hypothetical protein
MRVRAAPLVAFFVFACAKGGGDQETSPAHAGGGEGGGVGGGAPACAIDCASVQTDACQVSRCDTTSGNCEVVAAEDGTACDDGLFCTTNDGCKAGSCKGGPANDCNMTPGTCEVVSCDEDLASCTVAAAPNGITCVSEDLCQLAPTCTNGLCLGTANDCFFAPVPDECHQAVCNPSSGMCEPTPVPDGQSCFDASDPCTVAKTCAAGVCGGGEPKDCSFLDAGCLIGACDAVSGQCALQPGMPGQSCQAPGGACTIGVCDVNAVCVPQSLPNGSPCDDGDPCTVGETCQSNLCNGPINPQCHKLNAAYRGWWNNLGQHGLNGNTFTGQDQNGATYNSYFDFDLSNLGGTVVAAELVLDLESFWGPDAFESASVWDVSTSHQTLVASTFDPVVAQDLQSGASYGTFAAQPGDVGSKVSIPLGPQALADINAHLGSPFAVGVHIDTAQSSGEQGLGFSVMTEPHIHWLVLTMQ